MERDEVGKTSDVETSDAIDSRCAVNSLILDYYKKFGRKRDLEQYFSLSTAQSDIKDTSGTFWRKMKSENDSSDSGGRKSESPHEVCRIFITCSLPDPSSSQDDEQNTKTASPHTESPPIIIEEVPADVSRHTDEESIHFDDNNSQKSLDALLDLSTHKPLSPTSSITSQRKLEWDSLADVGYGNESDRKNSASSLSTLERLALKQQYSNNDSKQDIGAPTSHSTPLEEGDSKSKGKKGLGKKTTKIYKKDVDFVEVNVPHASDANQTPSINVNLTKHISFNVEKDGAITIDNVKRDLNISPEKVPVEAAVTPYLGMDKEIQTTLTKDKSESMDELPKPVLSYDQKIPVMISLNALRKRLRRKKARVVRKKPRTKKKVEVREDTPQEKSGEQLSEAESFEYMPGHMYNQNQMIDNEPKPDNSTAGNKSSLESSALNTDSSKDSKHSLTKDLEKCLDLLKVTLQKRYNDGDTKKKLIKEIVHRLINSKYRDDETTTEFLSGLSFNSKTLGITRNNITTSTSDANTSEDNKRIGPKKSILRNEKFNPNVASTSQSAPNLFSACSEKIKNSGIKKTSSNIDSDASSRGKSSSDNGFPKTTSEELYLKYLEAVRREQSYKRHLKDKEMFLKQKLVSSESRFKVPVRQESKITSRLKDLMKDLTRNNYDDGSGDASKLEGGSSNNADFERFNARNQRSHSVFTLSSSHSEGPKRPNLKKKMQAERELGEAGPSNGHYCCCPHHYLISKVNTADSCVQVNVDYQCADEKIHEKRSQTESKVLITMPGGSKKKSKPESPRNTRVVPDNVTGEIKYVCCCKGKPLSSTDVGDNYLIYKCCKLTNRGVQLEDPKILYNAGMQCGITPDSIKDDKISLLQPPCKMDTATESSCSDNTTHARRFSKSSQTNVFLCLGPGSSEKNYSSGSEGINFRGSSSKCIVDKKPSSDHGKKAITIHEATRCLQTEISINPKIADATLSDINVINDYDCAKLIAEHLRKVSISGSEKSVGGKSFSDGCTNSNSERLLIQSEDNLFREATKSSKPITDVKIAQNLKSGVSFGNDYRLPNSSTNTDLIVNLGSETSKKIEQINEAIITERIDITDKATSINEECTKSTQCRPCFCSVDPNINDRCASKQTPCTPKLCLSENVPKYNTHPKNEPLIEKIPFKRSNTDTGVLSVCSCIQTDAMKPADTEPNNNQITCIQTDSIKTVDFGTRNNQKTFIQTDSIKTADYGTNNNQIIKIKTCTLRTTETGTNNNQKLCIQIDTKSTDTESNNNKKISNQTNSTKTTDIETNNQNSYICEDKVITKDETSESKCQVDLKEASKECGTLNKKEEFVQPKQPSSIVRKEEFTILKVLTDGTKTTKKECDKKDVGIQKYVSDEDENKKTKTPVEKIKNFDIKTSETICKSVGCETESECKIQLGFCVSCQTEVQEKEIIYEDDPKTSSSDSQPNNIPLQKESSSKDSCLKFINKDPIMDTIHDITRRYCKNDMLKIKKKKCFTEIMTVLKYLLETEDSTEPEQMLCYSTSTETKSSSNKSKRHKMSEECCSDKLVDKSVQMSCEETRKVCNNIVCTESSDLPCSTDMPTTSSDSAACKVLNKIKKECEKYHQKKCKGGRKCDSSSTSVNCEKCKKIHYCSCRHHKCKRSKALEKLQKKCIAYNLIIQTSESMLSEEMVCEKKGRPLQNIIVKVPKRKDKGTKESTYKDQGTPRSPPCGKNKCNCKICPSESETSDEYNKRIEVATVREYLEQNRPDFVEKTSQRQNCLKFISERRASARAAHRNLLSLHLEQQPDLTNLSSDELRQLAQKIGLDLRRRQPVPKLISERDMKKHSEKIYKTLPEVVQKKEEKRKENIKKTNLLMANLFKKNLQNKALRGVVNLSNYSPVIKI